MKITLWVPSLKKVVLGVGRYTLNTLGVLISAIIMVYLEFWMLTEHQSVYANAFVGISFACGLFSFWYILQDQIEKEDQWSTFLRVLAVVAMIDWPVTMFMAAKTCYGRNRRRVQTPRSGAT